ncbi:hypothetical protein DV737_g10, partial [Chaetothyriales sp. CBS 132003]
MDITSHTNGDQTLRPSVEFGNPVLYRKFQIEKSKAMGLLIPQNLQLKMRKIDAAGQGVGSAFVTNNIKWFELFCKTAPSFQMYVAEDRSVIGEQDQHDQLVSTVTAPFMNGVKPTIANLELFKGDGWLCADYNFPPILPKTWTVKRHGWARHYEVSSNEFGQGTGLDPQRYIWKGSKHVKELVNDNSPRCHGNLKLLNGDGELLAAWKQRRDSRILGSISIFEAACDQLPIELIVTSCICIVIVEKMTGVTWFGS